MQETEKEKIKKAVQEEIEIIDYDPGWPRLFELEKGHLQACLPSDLIG